MFLIIPSERKIDWSSPPRATLLLIIINVLVFLFLQQNDDKRLFEAINYYLNSPLKQIELPLYQQYIKSTATQKIPIHNEQNDVFNMLFDQQWQKKIDQGLIQNDNPIYESWYESRKIFEQKLARVTFYHYGLIPAKYSLKTAISSTFLHGDIWHLIGNMVFLLIFGFSLEIILGPTKFFALYFISGVGGGSLFMIFNSSSYTPLIGASGAIAGLMGAYAVIYGLKKIQFFVWIIAYFNYIKLPALIVLPIWLIKEIWSNHQNVDSNIAYMAHVGGLITGAIIATIFSHTFIKNISKMNTQYIDSSDEEDLRDPFSEKLESAINFMRQLNFVKAKSQLFQLLKNQPNNLRALELMYNIEKIKPKGKVFKAVIERIFLITEKDKSLDNWVFNLYQSFRKLNPRGGLTVNRLSNLCYRFIRSSHYSEAEKIVLLIEGARPDYKLLPDMMLTLASSYIKSSQRNKGRDLLLKLEEEYSHTDQSQHASYLLDKIDKNQDF